MLHKGIEHMLSKNNRKDYENKGKMEGNCTMDMCKEKCLSGIALIPQFCQA